MEEKKVSLKIISSNLFVYGAAHAVVDGICAAVIFSIIKNQIVSTEEFIGLLILYNILAFGLQVIFGLVSDYIKSPRLAALTGCALTIVSSVTFSLFPVFAIISAGLGNALFHVGGGSISLNLTPKKASAPGIYVAPGAAGLLLGTLLGKSGQFIAWPFILILTVLCLFIFVIKKPEMNYEPEKVDRQRFGYLKLILLLIFLAVVIRSFVGMAIVFPWKTDINLLIVLTAAVVLGKGLGGILADKFGWMLAGVGALILSIPLLVFSPNIFYLAIFGMFLFNITMPITLVAISNVLPGRPGFAFGLTCLALIIGALPVFSSLKPLLGGQLFIFIAIIISSVVLYCGLQIYFRSYGERKLVS